MPLRLFAGSVMTPRPGQIYKVALALSNARQLEVEEVDEARGEARCRILAPGHPSDGHRQQVRLDVLAGGNWRLEREAV